MKKSLVIGFVFVLVVVGFVSGLSNITSESNITNNYESNATYEQSNNTNFNITNSTISTFIQEEITCIFDNSNETEKCYTIDGNFYCSGIDEKQSCSINIFGNKGEELGWMSSCGTYNLTIIDGTDKTIEFDCSVSQENAPGFGYAYAEYQCYDDITFRNLVQIQSTPSCKPYDSWKNIADNICRDKCGIALVEVEKGIYENQTMCGVRSFGISQECQQGLFDRLINWFKNLFG